MKVDGAIGMQTMLLVRRQKPYCACQATELGIPWTHTLAALRVGAKSVCALEYMTSELNN